MTWLHIDTDAGVDDALALLLAERLAPTRCHAISTVFGNVPLRSATRNVDLLNRLLGRADIPLYEGADTASDGFSRAAFDVHGDDGLGGATGAFAAAKPTPLPIEDVQPGPDGAATIILGLGPATNVPRLIAGYGRERIARIVLMSGVFFDTGNITPEAEFNAHCDPGALDDVLASGLPVTLVPLDVCAKVQLSRSVVRSWLERDPSPAVSLIVEAHMHYMDYYHDWEGIDGCYPHDVIALLAALEPGRFHRLRGSVDVVREGSRRGRTRFAPSEDGSVEIVTGGDLKWVRETLDRGWLELPARRRVTASV